jgi:hypothetical protein
VTYRQSWIEPLIFLDFDSVLGRKKDAPLYRSEKPLLAAFEAATRRIPDAELPEGRTNTSR